MKTFQIIICVGFLAAACAATLENPAVELKAEKSERDRDLQASLALAFLAVDNWLEANDRMEPATAERRLQELITEVAEQYNLISAIGNEEDEGEDELQAYGLGKKLKKWRNKAKKVVEGAVKAVVVNKAVGAAAGALG